MLNILWGYFHRMLLWYSDKCLFCLTEFKFCFIMYIWITLSILMCFWCKLFWYTYIYLLSHFSSIMSCILRCWKLNKFLCDINMFDQVYRLFVLYGVLILGMTIRFIQDLFFNGSLSWFSFRYSSAVCILANNRMNQSRNIISFPGKIFQISGKTLEYNGASRISVRGTLVGSHSRGSGSWAPWRLRIFENLNNISNKISKCIILETFQ